MASLLWDENGDTHRSRGYRIDHLRDDDPPWLLTLEDVTWPRFVVSARSDGERFRTLRSARAAALHMEVMRVRTAKLTRHIVLALMLLAAAGLLYSAMNVSTESSRIEWFVASLAALVLAWSEALSAFVILISEGWDHGYEVPRLSWIDRGVSGVTIWLTSAGYGAEDNLDQPLVQVLSLDCSFPWGGPDSGRNRDSVEEIGNDVGCCVFAGSSWRES